MFLTSLQWHLAMQIVFPESFLDFDSVSETPRWSKLSTKQISVNSKQYALKQATYVYMEWFAWYSMSMHPWDCFTMKDKNKKTPEKVWTKVCLTVFFQEFKIQKSVTTAGEKVFGSGELKAVNQTM